MLAIVIPYYKYTYFADTLNSLANQTDKRFKVYIGDDASPQDPSLILKKFKSQFDYKYQRFDQNLGSISLVKQWERCIDLIENEEWILLLGDDDMLGPTVVEDWYKNYHEFSSKSNVIRFSSKVISDSISDETKKVIHPVWESAVDAYHRKRKGLSRSSLSEYVFSKRSYKKYGFRDYTLGWHSDDMAWLDFSASKPIYTINSSCMYIRVSNESISGNNANQKTKQIAYMQFFKDLIKRKSKLFRKDEFLKMLVYYEVNIKKTRKLTFQDMFLVGSKYIVKFEMIQFLKFLRRYILSN